MNILVDVDNVILDLNSEWIRLYNEEYDDNLTILDVTSWTMTDVVKSECGNDIFRILDENMEAIYENCTLVPKALKSINYLKSIGFNIIYCTSGVMEAKIARLAREGLIENTRRGIIWPKDVVIATNKHLIKGLLIDDHIGNIKKGDLLLTQPWNLGKSHKGIRCNDWEEIVSYLINLKYSSKEIV